MLIVTNYIKIVAWASIDIPDNIPEAFFIYFANGKLFIVVTNR
jgi:hypothetical protein